jgi:hypothetical protein
MEMSKNENDLSPLGRQLLGHAGVMKLFTQTEFDAALKEAKAEIMAIAIQTSKQAIYIERNACADLALQWSQEELSEAIRHRMRPVND